jgi:hypothetical protein
VTREEWAKLARGIASWAPGPLDKAAQERAFQDVCDLTVEVAESVIETWRLLNGEERAPKGPDLRRLWAELAVDAPEPEDAAQRIRAIFYRHVCVAGDREGHKSAMAELALTAPVFERVSRRYGGPPPRGQDDLRRNWVPLYERCCDEERRRLLLREVEPTLPGLERLVNAAREARAAAA